MESEPYTVDPKSNFEEALGYLQLGLYEEAWQALDDLPPEWGTEPAVLRARAHCAVGWERWEMAEALALHLRHGDVEDRELSSDIFIRLAAMAYEDAALETSGRFVKLAIDTCADARLKIIDHPVLSKML